MKLVASGFVEPVPELSVQDKSIRVVLKALPVKLLGAAGSERVVAVAVFDGVESPTEAEAVT